MTKDETIIEFLKGLRIVLNNAFAYSKDHPYFVRSVEAFQEKVYALFGFLNPISIHFTPQSLFIDERYWEKEMLYTDLAASFHLRKIKGIEFHQGITTLELVALLSKLALSTRDIFRLGGLRNILENDNCLHVVVEELDYSDLLQDEGEESKDIWIYLFGQAVRSADQAKVAHFANNFNKFINKIRTHDLVEDKALSQNIVDFFNFLKKEEEDKFSSCTKDLIGFLIKDTQPIPAEVFDKLKEFINHLDKGHVAEALWDEIVHNDNFGQGNLAVFFSIFDKDAHAAIAPFLAQKVKESELFKNNPKIHKKLDGLFSSGDDSMVFEFYHHAMVSLIELDPESVTGFSFDQDHLEHNYQLLLLSLFVIEQDGDKLSLVVDNLIKVKKDLAFLKLLLKAMDEKLKDNVSLRALLEPLNKEVVGFIEQSAFETKDGRNFAFFAAKLEKSYLGLDFYLKKIFEERIISPAGLQLLYRFFPQQLNSVYDCLKEKRSDIEFMVEFIHKAKYIESILRQETLKKIFSFSNNLVRLEVLKLMRTLSQLDEQFLLSILEGEDFSLKREALLGLSGDPRALGIALPKLLSIPSPFGRNNARILESIVLVEETGTKEASEHLSLLTSRKFFWNREVRKKAREALAKLK